VCATSLDWLDGQIARRAGKETLAGNFLDSTLDRWGDLALLGAAAVLFRESLLLLLASLVAMASAVLVSYARAKAESLGASLTVGAMQRTERIALYCGGGLAGPLLDGRIPGWLAAFPVRLPPHPTFGTAIVLLALTTTVTATRRTVEGFQRIRRKDRPGASPP
jgi:phosphatidylglycerophosphate synthase